MPPTHALDNSLGAIVIGCMVSLFLFGTLTVQVLSYFRNFLDDSRKLKLMIAVIWVIEFIHAALICSSTYEKTVTYFGDVQELFHLRATFNLSVVCVGAIGPIVQSFYAYRILKISGRRFIPILCWILLLLRFVNVLAISITSFMVPDIIAYKGRFGWLLICSLSSSAAEDVLVTATTCYYLRAERRSSAHFRRTQRMMDLLILWTAQSALLTSSCTVSMLLCFLLMENFVWVGILLVFPLCTSSYTPRWYFNKSHSFPQFSRTPSSRRQSFPTHTNSTRTLTSRRLNSRTIISGTGKTTDLANIQSGLSFLSGPTADRVHIEMSPPTSGSELNAADPEMLKAGPAGRKQWMTPEVDV
ncbi:hypothetical protein C8R46DRAFT_270558 [Mycena filopes]|nr:hypothetical protein C8R46DRAFT_270558 [Mycena filopes]